MKKLVTIASLLIVASCASAIRGSTQYVNLRTEPDVPATCQITGTGNNFSSEVAAPGIVPVKRSYYPLNITCTPKKGGKPGTVKVASDVSGWAGYGGAVAGLGVGAGVDAGTGAAFEYPADIIVTLGESRTIGLNDMNSNVDFNK